MILPASQLSKREQGVLVGLYLARFDLVDLQRLGFKTFVEAYNAFGYAINSPPSSIKNYRDEFDPLLPNPRKGRHGRPIREYCLKVFENYKNLNLDSFAELISSFIGVDATYRDDADDAEADDDANSGFAKRLITGLAAEHYFESVRSKIPCFQDYLVENVTRLGCGYDFRLTIASAAEFLAVEVKGLRQQTGTLSLTPKEHRAAERLRKRFFLFVVKNFQASPTHEIFPNPLATHLEFTRVERMIKNVSWTTNV